MKYDPSFSIEGMGDCILIRRSNGWLRILKSYWDEMSERKKRMIINKWRRV